MYDYTAEVDPLVNLTHNLSGGGFAYNGQRVTFICTIVVAHDTVITWESDDYIGTGGDVLQLTSVDPEGTSATNPRNPTTVATLISTTRSSDGVITAISKLQLTASALSPTSYISCMTNGAGPVKTVTFQTSMLGKPELNLTNVLLYFLLTCEHGCYSSIILYRIPC